MLYTAVYYSSKFGINELESLSKITVSTQVLKTTFSLCSSSETQEQTYLQLSQDSEKYEHLHTTTQSKSNRGLNKHPTINFQTPVGLSTWMTISM
jgi:uncharacterized lipoprotein YddW (UPF0748 family)